jgi:hypothetical protein
MNKWHKDASEFSGRCTNRYQRVSDFSRIELGRNCVNTVERESYSAFGDQNQSSSPLEKL